jgi:hypothetical protein
MFRALLLALVAASPAAAEALITTNPCVEFCGVFATDAMIGTVTSVGDELVIEPEFQTTIVETALGAPYVRDCFGAAPLCDEVAEGDRRAFFFGQSGNRAYALDADDRLTDTVALFDGTLSAEVAIALGTAPFSECMQVLETYRDTDKCQDPVPGGCAAGPGLPPLALLLLLVLARRRAR